MPTEKFKAMVHYIVASCKEPQRLGATRLNKICWYSDTFSYRLRGVPITGETYVKRQHGPVPKSILHTVRQLEDEGKIHVRDHHILPSHKMRMFVALEDADTSSFKPEELQIIDFVAEQVCDNHSAVSISELSHDVIWDAANDGEEIPLAATLVASPAVPREEIIAWTKRVIDKAEAAKRTAA